MRTRVAGSAAGARERRSSARFFAPDVVAFDVVPPPAYRGRDAYRKLWERLFTVDEGKIEYEIRNVRIAADSDVAFSRSLNRIGGTLKNGKKTGFWVRMTAGWRKVDGEWLIEHEHVSVPVDLEKNEPVLES